MVKRIKESALILAFALLSAFMFNNFAVHGIDLIYEHVELKNGTVVSLYESKNIFENKQALFIDARPANFYRSEHIPNAINVPYDAKNKGELLVDISIKENIVVYCFSKKCNQARILAAALKNMGFLNVAVFDDGIQKWKAAGYPLKTIF